MTDPGASTSALPSRKAEPQGFKSLPKGPKDEENTRHNIPRPRTRNEAHSSRQPASILIAQPNRAGQEVQVLRANSPPDGGRNTPKPALQSGTSSNSSSSFILSRYFLDSVLPPVLGAHGRKASKDRTKIPLLGQGPRSASITGGSSLRSGGTEFARAPGIGDSLNSIDSELRRPRKSARETMDRIIQGQSPRSANVCRAVSPQSEASNTSMRAFGRTVSIPRGGSSEDAGSEYLFRGPGPMTALSSCESSSGLHLSCPENNRESVEGSPRGTNLAALTETVQSLPFSRGDSSWRGTAENPPPTSRAAHFALYSPFQDGHAYFDSCMDELVTEWAGAGMDQTCVIRNSLDTSRFELEAPLGQQMRRQRRDNRREGMSRSCQEPSPGCCCCRGLQSSEESCLNRLSCDDHIDAAGKWCVCLIPLIVCGYTCSLMKIACGWALHDHGHLHANAACLKLLDSPYFPCYWGRKCLSQGAGLSCVYDASSLCCCGDCGDCGTCM